MSLTIESIRAGEESTGLMKILEQRVEDLFEDVKGSLPWLALSNPDTPDVLVHRIMKEVYREIAWYQEDIVEAAVQLIGQLPRDIPEKDIRSMLIHQAAEWDHGEMALRDLVGFGDEDLSVRNTMSSPASFAAAAVWRHMAHKRLPFAYFGAMYMFEALTPLVTDAIRHSLRDKGMDEKNLEFVEFHAKEDVGHARLIGRLIDRAIDLHPEGFDEVVLGFDYFEQVYPLPVWKAAYERAINATG